MDGTGNHKTSKNYWKALLRTLFVERNSIPLFFYPSIVQNVQKGGIMKYAYGVKRARIEMMQRCNNRIKNKMNKFIYKNESEEIKKCQKDTFTKSQTK